MISAPPIIATLPQWTAQFLQYKSYAILFVAAACCTALATPLYILMAQRLGWVDHPQGRKQHDRATVTMGGLVIFAIVFAGAIVAIRLPNMVGDMLRAKSLYIYGLLICTGCMILLGVIDDRHGVRPKVKLLVQVIVAIAAVSLGFRVQAITLPWLDSVTLPAAVGIILSLLWIIGITNAINLTDGLDGLAAGICFLAASVNAGVAIWLGNYYMSVMMLLLAGALLGFLRWNFHPARVFLGDTGSLSLGMYLALASLHSAQKSHTVVLILVPLFALGYPIFDTLLAIARRMARGQPIFAGDREHIHHRLLDRSHSPSSVTWQIYLGSMLLCVLCIAAMTANHLVVGLALAGVLGLALFSARFLGYLEWGGWMARWSGREETKTLHAAAHLARLRIAQARNMDAIARGLATIAPEFGLSRVSLHDKDGREFVWKDSEVRPVLTKYVLPDSDSITVTLEIAEGAPFDDEHRQLLTELMQLAIMRSKSLATQLGPCAP